jgi:hypothetical protein
MAKAVGNGGGARGFGAEDLDFLVYGFDDRGGPGSGVCIGRNVAAARVKTETNKPLTTVIADTDGRHAPIFEPFDEQVAATQMVASLAARDWNGRTLPLPSKPKQCHRISPKMNENGMKDSP